MCGRRAARGWLDIQMVLAVILVNLAGGDCVEDIERLERDSGFSAILRAIEKDLLSRAERRSLKSRFRRERERATPSPSALSGWLERFHDPNSPKAAAGAAFIPAVTEELEGLWRVNQALLAFLHQHQPARLATLDMDATLIETDKRDALYCYEKFKAYQPLNCWWAEQGAMLYSEFRDGNVPAGHEQLRVLKESLRHLPESVKKVALRSDTAGYQEELLLYCGEGKDSRFGVIDFAIGADVSEAFRAAALATPESEWRPLIRIVDGKSYGPISNGPMSSTSPIGPDTVASAPIIVPGDPRAAAPIGAGGREGAAVSHPGVRPQGPPQAVRRGDQPAGSGRRGDLVVAGALRQERGGAFGDEIRSGRRTDAVRAVRRQRRLVGAGDPGVQSERGVEALGARRKPGLQKRMKALRFHLIGLPGRVVSHARRVDHSRRRRSRKRWRRSSTPGRRVGALAHGPAG